MKRLIIAFTLVLTISACGGGGGGGNTTPPIMYDPGPGSTPTPAPTPTPIPIANTSLSVYAPLASGNTWTFASGGKIVDMGGGPLSCSCAASGYKIEQLAEYAPNSSTISASLFVTKNAAGATTLTNVIGVENDAGNGNITIASSTQYPYGVPIMDDNPFVNESWTDGVGDTSTITSVGRTMMLPNNTEVIDIATDALTGSFNPITWSFAKGVGFTSISLGNQTTNMVSFYVNPNTSYSVARKPEAIAIGSIHGTVGNVDMRSALRPLFK